MAEWTPLVPREVFVLDIAEPLQQKIETGLQPFPETMDCVTQFALLRCEQEFE